LVIYCIQVRKQKQEMNPNSQFFSASFYLLTSEQQYEILFEAMYSLSEENGWGDPFNYARSREIHMAAKLGHKVGETYSGKDAEDPNTGQEQEYKSTISDKIKGTYTGVSVQSSWHKQEKYLREEKLGKYNHVYARYENGRIAEMWGIPGSTVCKILIPKFKKAYLSSSNKKDPRLSAIITHGEIYEYGTKIY